MTDKRCCAQVLRSLLASIIIASQDAAAKVVALSFVAGLCRHFALLYAAGWTPVQHIPGTTEPPSPPPPSPAPAQIAAATGGRSVQTPSMLPGMLGPCGGFPDS